MKITILYGTRSQAMSINIRAFQESIKEPGLADAICFIQYNAKQTIEALLKPNGDPAKFPLEGVNLLLVVTDGCVTFPELANATYHVRSRVKEHWMRDILQAGHGEFAKAQKPKPTFACFDEMTQYSDDELEKLRSIIKIREESELWKPVVDTTPRLEHINFKKTFEYSWDQIDIPLSDTAQRLRDIVDFERLNPATIVPVEGPADMLEQADFHRMVAFNNRHRG